MIHSATAVASVSCRNTNEAPELTDQLRQQRRCLDRFRPQLDALGGGRTGGQRELLAHRRRVFVQAFCKPIERASCSRSGSSVRALNSCCFFLACSRRWRSAAFSASRRSRSASALRSRSSFSRCAMIALTEASSGARGMPSWAAVVDPQLPFAGRQARQTLGFETLTPNHLLGRDFRLWEADNFRIIAHRIGLL